MATRLEAIKDLHKRVQRQFNYKFDKDNYGVLEDWRSLYEEFAAGKIFEDDCDGNAFTAAEALIKEELAYPEEVFVFRCMTPWGRKKNKTAPFDHMVCGVNVENETWIIDINHRELTRMDEMTDEGHEWYDYMGYGDKGNWYRVELE